ncbi:MAG: hypothetical protein SFU84_10510 [Gemmatimonadales bacterium]|nr:hypothetical protein [Gemmatimonadales bacterium]
MATNQDDPIDPRLAEAIATLRDTPPSDDLWPEIAPRLAPRHPAGTLLLRWPTAIAAGLVIATASIGGTLLLLRGDAVTPAPSATQASLATPANAVAAAHTPADQALQRAIGELEGRLALAEGSFDATTRDGIRASLDALDRAIADAAARQRATPDDARSAHYLTSALQKKLEVLRTLTRRTAIRT